MNIEHTMLYFIMFLYFFFFINNGYRCIAFNMVKTLIMFLIYIIWSCNLIVHEVVAELCFYVK